MLKDESLRKAALQEIIGDAEIKQINLNNCDELVFRDCVVYQSNITGVRHLNFQNNTAYYCTIKGIEQPKKSNKKNTLLEA